jgi:glycosyltransferase involved in cell wall biosynthesis
VHVLSIEKIYFAIALNQRRIRMSQEKYRECDLPKVSVIVPVYNVAPYLEECLSSLARQSLHRIEIICIDDGSTDDSPAILSSYSESDDRFRIIRQVNSGVSAARNKGLSIAEGDYVLFVDSDDYIREDACEKLLAFSQENDLDIVVFGGKTFPTVQWADDSFAQNDVIYAENAIRALFDEPGSRPLMCNKMFRRTFLEANHCMLDSTLKLGEDHAFQFDVFPYAKKIGYLKDKLYFYRTRDASAVNASIEDYFGRIMKHVLVVESVFSSWKKKGLISKHESDLCIWSTNFLYQDAQYLYPGELDRFSQKYYELISSYHLEGTLARIPDYVREKAIWMLGSDRGKTVEGVEDALDLIVLVNSDPSDLRGLVDSLMHSPDRGFSLKLVCREGNSTGSAFPVPIDGEQVCLYPSVEAALESCQSLYVSFVSPACRYTKGFLGKVLDSINAYSEPGPSASLGLPDVISFADEDGLLGVSDLLSVSKPSTECALADRYLIEPASLQGGWYLAASPVPWNKLFLRDKFVSFYQANKEGERNLPLQACIFGFQVQCNSILHLFDFDALAVDSSSFRTDISKVDFVGRGLGLGNWMGICEKDALQMALSFCAINLDLSISCANFCELFDAISGLLKEFEEQRPQAIDELRSTCLDRRVLLLMSGESSEEYRKERMMSLLSSLQARGKKDSDLLEAQRCSIAELNERLNALNSSVSFRVGRKLTAVPRKIASVFKLR